MGRRSQPWLATRWGQDRPRAPRAPAPARPPAAGGAEWALDGVACRLVDAVEELVVRGHAAGWAVFARPEDPAHFLQVGAEGLVLAGELPDELLVGFD